MAFSRTMAPYLGHVDTEVLLHVLRDRLNGSDIFAASISPAIAQPLGSNRDSTLVSQTAQTIVIPKGN